MQEDTKAMSTPTPWHLYTYDRLDALRLRWTVAEQVPPEVGGLSSGEHAALALACGHESAMASPVVAFLLLDGWLQRWVMKHRGLSQLIGARIGV